MSLTKELKGLHRMYETQIEQKEKELKDLKELKDIVAQEILYGGVELIPEGTEEIELMEETRQVIEKIKLEVSNENA